MERFIRHIEGIDVVDTKELFSPDAWRWEREADRRGGSRARPHSRGDRGVVRGAGGMAVSAAKVRPVSWRQKNDVCDKAEHPLPKPQRGVSFYDALRASVAAAHTEDNPQQYDTHVIVTCSDGTERVAVLRVFIRPIVQILRWEN